MLRSFPPVRATGAILLLAALLLGGAAHAWHHAADQDCEDVHSRNPHPCTTCAALHLAPLGGQAANAIPRDLLEFERVAPRAVSSPTCATPHQAAPRAPPVA